MTNLKERRNLSVPACVNCGSEDLNCVNNVRETRWWRFERRPWKPDVFIATPIEQCVWYIRWKSIKAVEDEIDRRINAPLTNIEYHGKET